MTPAVLMTDEMDFILTDAEIILAVVSPSDSCDLPP